MKTLIHRKILLWNKYRKYTFYVLQKYFNNFHIWPYIFPITSNIRYIEILPYDTFSYKSNTKHSRPNTYRLPEQTFAVLIKRIFQLKHSPIWNRSAAVDGPIVSSSSCFSADERQSIKRQLAANDSSTCPAVWFISSFPKLLSLFYDLVFFFCFRTGMTWN